MSLLFDLEALAGGGGLTALQSQQRDFSPYVFHFTSYGAMKPVRERLNGIGKGEGNASDLVNLLRTADDESAKTLRAMLSSGVVEARHFSKDYAAAVCLTECTLAGVLTHSSRYGRYGLVFPKSVVYGYEARPLAYVPDEIRRFYKKSTDEIIQKNALYVTILRPPQGGGRIQDYTHEREWRCPRDIPVSEAVALIVAKAADYRDFRDVSEVLPVIPLELLYRMGV